MNQLSTIQNLVIWILPVLFAITVHEVAHGWVASKLGDKTALMMGRLTLNPLKHIDPLGTILMPIVLFWFTHFIFGWAKPVPVNFSNLNHPKRDMALVAAAGPGANLVMAFIWAIVAKLGVVLFQHGMGWSMAILYMGQAGIMINVWLMVLNLIPIPPLDGSRIVTAFLSDRAGLKYNRLEPYGFFILLFLLAIGALRYIIAPLSLLVFRLIAAMFGL